MRKDITAYILTHIYKNIENSNDLTDAYKYYSKCKETLELCTLEQLWSLYKLVQNDRPFKIISCDPTDHLAVELSGLLGTMYLGIEVDGYAHS